jgi:DNA-binding response OmpR family regulator
MADKKKILIVDDEVDFVEMMRIRWEADGFEVLVAGSGKEALDMMRKDKPDAVLLDIMMPEEDGLSILKQIRSESKDLPVFIVTGFSNESRKVLAANLNASGFIVKGQQDMSAEMKSMKAIIEITDRHKPSRG